jgi:molybdate transport system substrate-binding protein
MHRGSGFRSEGHSTSGNMFEHLVRILSWPAIAILFLATVSGCGDRGFGGGGDAVLVLAASDLQLALPEIAREFEAQQGGRVQLVFGSTGNLTTQIEQGAPADLFLAANESFIDRLDRAGLIDPGTRILYAEGRLATAWRAGGQPIQAPQALQDPRFTAISIANPEHAPYGVAAREMLESLGILGAVQGRLVFGENVAQALQLVQSGNADAGIVALPVVIGMSGIEYLPIDPSLHQPLRQAGAVLRDAVDPFGGEAFLDFIMSDAGQGILRRYGFEAP